VATAVQTPEEAKGIKGRGSSKLLTTALVFPAALWYLVLLVAPLLIVIVFSFGNRAKNGGYDPAFTFDNYSRLLLQPERLEPFITSLWMAVAGTIGCLLVGLPLAYFIATRATRHKGLFILLLVIPFWTSFLIRTYSWLIVLGRENVGGFIGTLIGDPEFRILGTPAAVLVGLVYGYLPLMVFPIYVSLEKLDRRLLEASADLYATPARTFLQVTLPLSLPGVATGSMLVFILLMGEFLIPALLGGGKVFFVGNALVDLFLQSRNWPLGSAVAIALVVIMLVAVALYLLAVGRERGRRDVSLV
jgi:spermidine/putrescine transport system permease protein